MASVRKKHRLTKKRTRYWSHRYSKPFIIKKLARFAQAACVLSQGLVQISLVRAAPVSQLDKALELANLLLHVQASVAKTIAGDDRGNRPIPICTEQQEAVLAAEAAPTNRSMQ